MRVGYCRVSTRKAEQDVSLEGQQQQLKQAGRDEVIVERASAFKGERKGWIRLWALVASGKVSEVLVVDQSRLSRSGDDLEFLEACAVKGVTVRALTGGNIEIESVGGFIQAGVMSVMNQAYSRLNSAKVKDGIARRRAAGHYAMGNVCFGFAYVDGVVVPHPDNWQKARARWEWLLANEMNVHAFCVAHPDCSYEGMRNWIRNPMLRGQVPYQSAGVKPVISPNEWAVAKRLLSKRTISRTRGGSRNRYLFSGSIRCADCGKNLTRAVTPYGRVRWKCLTPGCGFYGRSIAEQVARNRLIEALREQAPRLALEAQQASNAMRVEMTPEQISKARTLEQLELLRDSGTPELDRSIELLRREIEMPDPVVGPDWSALIPLLQTPGVFERFTDAQLRPLLLEFVAQLVYTGDPRNIEVVLRQG